MPAHKLNCISQTDLSLIDKPYIYSLLLLPSSQLAAISSNDTLSIFPNDLSLPPTRNYPSIHASVTSLAYSASDPSILATCGRDSLIHIWDARTPFATPTASLRCPNNLPLSALALHLTTPLLAAGIELEGNPPGSAPVYVYDLRSPSKPLLELLESHNDTITSLSFHPSHANLLLSASTDALVNLFTIDQPTEEDALHQIINHGSAVQHAGFLAPSNLIYSLGTDETLSIHALHSPDEGKVEPKPQDLGDVRSALGCEYVVDLYARDEGSVYIAVGNYSTGDLRLIPLEVGREAVPGDLQVPREEGDEGGERWECVGAHGEEIVRDVVFDTASETVFTCGEDGLVKAWRPGSNDSASGAKSTKERRRAGKEAKKDAKRFNPY